MAQNLSKHCIYTIAHKARLDEEARESGPVTLEESKAWVTGARLWREAQAEHLGMPVLLGDAAYVNQLLYWGLLQDLQVDDSRTVYKVDRLRPIQGQHFRQELVLRSSGKNIDPNFIRPYAICLTPPFLDE